MDAETRELRLVREALESFLSPALVETVLSEALADGTPQGVDATLAFVRGPLRSAVAKRVGVAHASPVITRVEALVREVTPPSSRPPQPERRRSEPRRPAVRNEIQQKQRKRRSHTNEETREIRLNDHVVKLVIVGTSNMLRDKLLGSLDRNRIAPLSASSLQDVRENLVTFPAPAICIVDASDFPSIDMSGLANLMRASATATVQAIWGAELPIGAQLAEVLHGRESPAVLFDRNQGLEPLVDLIRSLRK